MVFLQYALKRQGKDRIMLSFLPNSQACNIDAKRFAKLKALLRMGLRVYQAGIHRYRY
jgi:hypothetical protein